MREAVTGLRLRIAGFLTFSKKIYNWRNLKFTDYIKSRNIYTE
uniref:Uncharacterized protein n=1 Tax=Inoviridae sp. ctPjN3 TaxID=2826761 RepID=A0A8S5NHL9_9VIRU|nr:MAG TPA: hypothetical protein [Inoviridae sp. ctPjN3]